MPYTIRLRAKAFTKAAQLKGFRSDYVSAEVTGVNRSTVTRVRKDDLQPGPTSIGGALTALTPMEFDDLFGIVAAPSPAQGGRL